MVTYFDDQKSRPKYVNDLTREIRLVEEWYEARFHEMDAYFGIEDGVDMIMMPDSDEKAIYDLSGRKIESEFLAPGIYIIDGDAVVIK